MGPFALGYLSVSITHGRTDEFAVCVCVCTCWSCVSLLPAAASASSAKVAPRRCGALQLYPTAATAEGSDHETDQHTGVTCILYTPTGLLARRLQKRGFEVHSFLQRRVYTKNGGPKCIHPSIQRTDPKSPTAPPRSSLFTAPHAQGPAGRLHCSGGITSHQIR